MSHKNYLVAAVLAFSMVFTLTGCAKWSELTGSDASSTSNNIQRDGVLALSRRVPDAKTLTQSLLGFMPVRKAHKGKWATIDRALKLVTVMHGDKTVESITGDGLQSLKPGSYTVVHKQRDALWYAPDSYFDLRQLPTPGTNDGERFRRGALGEFAIFIDKETPLHSGPMWLDEIGGAQLSDKDISRLYYSLEVGSTIEVR